MNDLIKHFLVGLAIGIVLVAVGILFFGKYLPNGYVLTAFFIPFVIGAGKEVVWDLWLKKGTPEIADIVFTWTGGIVPVFIWKLIENFI